jgi:hypothetical protein
LSPSRTRCWSRSTTSSHAVYTEQGAAYFDARHAERITQRAVRALERQGYRVVLERAA